MNEAAVVAFRLQRLAPLTPASAAVVWGLSGLQSFAPGSHLVHDGQPLRPRFIISGWAARARHLPDGRRQIVGFILPGEGLGLCERPQPLALCPVVALTAVTTVEAGDVARAAFGSGVERRTDLRAALHLSAALEEHHLIDQAVRLGRQSALERVAHLLLELRHRHQLTQADPVRTFDFPVTQEQLADATGLSAVHVNRTLQQMRKDGLLELQQGQALLLRPELLEVVADWTEPQINRWSISETAEAS